LVGLLFPRLALFAAWLVSGAYPPNNLPDLLNLVLWVCVPRLLLAYYIYLDTGMATLWFWVYLATGVVSLIGEPAVIHRRIYRRKTIRQGDTVTTIEEEEV
jgi:hypothetical protein